MTTISEALREFGNTPYVLTVGDDGPHTSHSTVTLAPDGRSLTGPLSKSAAKNVASQPAMSLFWPPQEPSGYGIIMNGTAQVIATDGPDPLASIALTKAVFHRPGKPGPRHEGTCTSDCRPIRLTRT
ncbi:MAG: hypothetical protein OXH15_11600 [Gammaproteobacteria bacterium]|nr:hypothetical protein [Gammaproteobacteria bacterium]